MKLTSRTTLATVAAAVGDVLRRSGIDAVLTGGACASLHSRGRYQSNDVDFILGSPVGRVKLDQAMAGVGFAREGDRYVHPETAFYVEFPAGPLAIGSDASIRPIVCRKGALVFRSLDATDSVRDRLAAYLFWRDLQAFDAAVQIALLQPLVASRLRRWFDAEGRLAELRNFLRAVEEASPTSRRPRHVPRRRGPGRTGTPAPRRGRGPAGAARPP